MSPERVSTVTAIDVAEGTPGWWLSTRLPSSPRGMMSALTGPEGPERKEEHRGGEEDPAQGAQEPRPHSKTTAAGVQKKSLKQSHKKSHKQSHKPSHKQSH